MTMDSQPQRSIPRSYGDGLPAEQRQALDAERDQLLRLRKELHEGKNLVEEQVGRIAMAAGAGYRKEEMKEQPPPPPPYQYVRSSVPMTQPARQPPPPMRSPPQRSPPSGNNGVVVLPPSRVFDSSVMSLFNKHVQPLKRIYRHYMSREDTGADAVGVQSFLRCLSDFDVTPTFASKKEVREAFEQARVSQQQRQTSSGLDFPGFVDALGLVAVNTLGKPMFAHLYQTPQSRVSVLLGMWGLGDPATFDAVLQREKYARTAGARSSGRGGDVVY